MASALRYPLPLQDALPGWRKRLIERLPLQADSPESYRIHYYDSFDWRLFRSGTALKWEQRDGESRCYLYNLEGGAGAASLPLPEPPPGFAADLPAGRLRQRLSARLGVRALLPLATLEVRSHCLRLKDPEGKTRLRLFLEQHRLRTPDNRARLLSKQVRVVPLRGYEKDAAEIITLLEDELGVQPEPQDLLLRALAALGKEPATSASKLDIPLEPELRADAALRRVLLVLLATMERNEAGAIASLDTEFLHDFRVAVRRTRSALTQIKGVLPKTVLNRYKREFAWLGQITTPSRDLDVYVLQFDDYKHSLPESARVDIEPLRNFLLRHQEIEHRTLARRLDSVRYRRLKQNWRKFLTQPVSERSTLANAQRPVVDVACERIWRVYRRAIKEGRAITQDSPAEALHELRKTCKKLRYLMEFFQSLFPDSEIKALIKVLKQLQDNLGDFQDYEVQVLTLRQFSQQMVKEDAAPAETLLAMGMLIEGLERRQHAARAEFAEHFAGFDQQDNLERYRRLFHPPEPAAQIGRLAAVKLQQIDRHSAERRANQRRVGIDEHRFGPGHGDRSDGLHCRLDRPPQPATGSQ